MVKAIPFIFGNAFIHAVSMMVTELQFLVIWTKWPNVKWQHHPRLQSGLEGQREGFLRTTHIQLGDPLKLKSENGVYRICSQVFTNIFTKSH